jgi:hypothetical protein
VRGLAGTPYARAFVVHIAANAALLAAAEAYGPVPPEVELLLSDEDGASS